MILALQSGSSGWVGVEERVVLPMADGEEGSYRPTSKAGDARGESSVAIVKTPSNFLSG